jgi:hypothetical protein
MLWIEGCWDSINFTFQSSVGEKLLWGLLPLYEHAKWPSAQGSCRFWDFKAELHSILKNSYTTNVSKRAYFQTKLFCGFKFAQRLNFMGMLQNRTTYSFKSLVGKSNTDRSGFCPVYIFSPSDTFRKKAEDTFPLFCFSCSLPNMCQVL